MQDVNTILQINVKKLKKNVNERLKCKSRIKNARKCCEYNVKMTSKLAKNRI